MKDKCKICHYEFKIGDSITSHFIGRHMETVFEALLLSNPKAQLHLDLYLEEVEE